MEFDDDRFFSGASRGDYLEALTAHAGLGSVVVVDGEAGSGVSTLLGQAVMALLDDFEVVRIDGSDEHDGNAVVDALLRHFDITRPELPETLRRTLVEGRIVVVVDNSEQLSADALGTMASLKQKLAGRLGYFFGGLPGGIDQIKAAGFTVDDVLSLPALVAEDVQDLAWFVLGLEVDDAESEVRCQEADGNLGALLKALTSGEGGADERGVGDDEMRFGAHDPDDEFDGVVIDEGLTEGEAYAEEEGVEKTAPPWRHIAAVAGLLVVVVLLWTALSSGAKEEEATRAIALPVPAQPEKEVGPEADEEGDVRPIAPTMEPVARLEDLQNREPEVREEGGVILEPVSDPVMQSDPPPKDTVMTLPQDPETSGADEVVASESEQQAPAQSASLVDAEGYRHAGWLATVDDDRWFLQITATGQQEGARGVLDQVGRKGAYYEARRNGKVVWLVLSGDYASRQAALDAKSSLPAKLQQAGPFPRKMGDIRSEL